MGLRAVGGRVYGQDHSDICFSIHLGRSWSLGGSTISIGLVYKVTAVCQAPCFTGILVTLEGTKSQGHLKALVTQKFLNRFQIYSLPFYLTDILA